MWGTSTPTSASRLRPISAVLRPSTMKSSSARRLLANSTRELVHAVPAALGGRLLDPLGQADEDRQVALDDLGDVGRWALMTTDSPVVRVAK